MSIYDILKDEHREVMKMVEQAQDADGAERDELIEQIIDALTAHAAAEEEVLYDRVASADALHDLVGEAREEHVSVTRILHDLLRDLPDDEVEAKLSVLQEQLEHHVEEEEGEMFTKCEQILDDEVAEAIGGEFLVKKAELQEIPIDERVEAALAEHGIVEIDEAPQKKPQQRAPTPEEEERTAERG